MKLTIQIVNWIWVGLGAFFMACGIYDMATAVDGGFDAFLIGLLFWPQAILTLIYVHRHQRMTEMDAIKAKLQAIEERQGRVIQ